MQFCKQDLTNLLKLLFPFMISSKFFRVCLVEGCWFFGVLFSVFLSAIWGMQKQQLEGLDLTFPLTCIISPPITQ